MIYHQDPTQPAPGESPLPGGGSSAYPGATSGPAVDQGTAANWYQQYPWFKVPNQAGTTVVRPTLDGSWDPNTQGNGIYNALALGKSGEDAVNWANQNFGGGYAYRPDAGTYSLPNGGYVGKNGQGSYFYGAGDKGGGNVGGLGGVNPDYLTPFGNQTDLNSRFGSAPPTFQAPAAFQAPTGADVLNDPSYQFRRDQSLDALSKTSAAQGLFNSGGTPYDLANLASNFASQEYGNVWNRDFGVWNQSWANALSTNNANLADYQNARDTYYANQSNPFSKLNSVANLGATTAANAG